MISLYHNTHTTPRWLWRLFVIILLIVTTLSAHHGYRLYLTFICDNNLYGRMATLRNTLFDYKDKYGDFPEASLTESGNIVAGKGTWRISLNHFNSDSYWINGDMVQFCMIVFSPDLLKDKATHPANRNRSQHHALLCDTGTSSIPWDSPCDIYVTESVVLRMSKQHREEIDLRGRYISTYGGDIVKIPLGISNKEICEFLIHVVTPTEHNQ